jgi:hypothetical protein
VLLPVKSIDRSKDIQRVRASIGCMSGFAAVDAHSPVVCNWRGLISSKDLASKYIVPRLLAYLADIRGPVGSGGGRGVKAAMTGN